MAPARDWSLAAGIGTMTAWGVSFSVTKHILEGVGVEVFIFLRFSLLPLLGVLLLVAIFRHRAAHTWPRREDLGRFVACALIGHTVHISAVMYGMSLSTAFSSSLVLTAGPLFTLMILAALGAERLRARQVVGTLVAFAGIVVFLADKFAAGLSRAGVGDLVLLLGAACFSLYTVLAQPLVKRYGPLIVLTYTLLFSAPPILVLTLPAFLAAPVALFKPSILLGILYSLVFSSFVGWMVWSWVNTVRGVARSAPLNYLMPPIAGLVAWFTLGESFTTLKLLGAAITMAGVAWAQFGGGPPRKETAQPDAG